MGGVPFRDPNHAIAHYHRPSDLAFSAHDNRSISANSFDAFGHALPRYASTEPPTASGRMYMCPKWRDRETALCLFTVPGRGTVSPFCGSEMASLSHLRGPPWH